MKDAAYFVDRFQHLRRDDVRGRWTKETAYEAPHKPLLLINVVDSYLDDPERPNSIEPTQRLSHEFDKYWSRIFLARRTSTVALPFFHLKTDGFWYLVPVDHTPATEARIGRSLSALQRAVRHATLDEDLHAVLGDPAWATHLRSVIVAGYFAPELHRHFVQPMKSASQRLPHGRRASGLGYGFAMTTLNPAGKRVQPTERPRK
jgi:predicted restriction endonuclease